MSTLPPSGKRGNRHIHTPHSFNKAPKVRPREGYTHLRLRSLAHDLTLLVLVSSLFFLPLILAPSWFSSTLNAIKGVGESVVWFLLITIALLVLFACIIAGERLSNAWKKRTDKPPKPVPEVVLPEADEVVEETRPGDVKSAGSEAKQLTEKLWRRRTAAARGEHSEPEEVELDELIGSGRKKRSS
ncbi:hypothetical protein MNV49_000656 [Pseudohyphozyma bogoriensis]|nr:hypothetical protein MNV49_000656 [Pseudohyphozyma bogoriensis]